MDEETKVLTQNFTLGKLFKYVLPTILAILLASVYGIVDGIFVSNFGGTTAFAAINQMSPIFMIIAAVGFMFGTGGSALVGKILVLATAKKPVFGLVITIIAGVTNTIGDAVLVGVMSKGDPLQSSEHPGGSSVSFHKKILSRTQLISPSLAKRVKGLPTPLYVPPADVTQAQ